MPIVTASNNYLLGVHKQTNEGTVGTVADYTMPVFGGAPTPTYETGQVTVTDAAAIAGDTYKRPSSWVLDNAIAPAFDNAIGTLLVGLWGTDTPSGTAPTRLHTFTGLGGAQPWMSFYSVWGAGSKKHTFGKGLITGLTFEATEEGGPVRVGISAMGQTVTDEASTATVATSTADGYFTLQHATSTIAADVDTPNSVPGVALTGVKNVTVGVTRNASPEATVEATQVGFISQGVLTPTVEMSWLWQDWTGFNANFFGAAAGTTLSGTQVTGALNLIYKHSVSANSMLRIYIPAMVFEVQSPEPNPDGSPLTMAVTGRVQKPSSGEHVQVFLTNNVTPAY